MELYLKNVQSIRDKVLKQQLLMNRYNYSKDIEIETSKKGPLTLKKNNHYLYSRYDPIKDVSKFIDSQIDPLANMYCLFGFGLGYHVEQLMAKEPSKKIIVIDTDISTIQAAIHHIDLTDILSNENVQFIILNNPIQIQEFIRNLDLDSSNIKWIIPQSWISTITNSSLKEILEDIKIKEMSFLRMKNIMEENFQNNIQLFDSHIGSLLGQFEGKKAALVAAGPSLDDNIDVLKQLKNKYFLLCVGAAYKTLLHHNIEPDAIVMSDPHDLVFEQVKGVSSQIPLIFLATVNKEVVRYWSGTKIILFQEGYPPSEQFAKEHQIPLIQTGGSVATTGLDVLIKMGFAEIVFFGQDLAYKGNQSHSIYSTSNKTISFNQPTFTVETNSHERVATSRSWLIFRKWIEQKIQQTPKVQFKNTSYNGALIKGAPYVAGEHIANSAKNMEDINFLDLISKFIK
ncbi:motility associated factor glycosyltransferase family protein [Thermaerobacillus caldiproteolyticus]|uniref:DUF115 domain-containing protein n=1 Tax=Thermaerobacillus caldiproteolyticus TaxID=247480 RepID=A0A7W0BZZ5_9BACL|nr:6-hydroxymethylpterin diphosphokinase MptE-like protein [Anoxybacillus caldiproteolyticus]MBA2874629.1 hypothetical protein [Anoxybacillus caldiproteolyticus]